MRNPVSGTRLNRASAWFVLALCSQPAFGQVGAVEPAPQTVLSVPALAFSSVELPRSDSSEPDVPVEGSTEPHFGESKGLWWSIGGGAAFAGRERDYSAAFMIHYFLAENFEINATLGGWYHDQVDRDEDEGGDGEVDTGSGQFAFGFRWHFVNQNDWTAYVDTGIGLLVAGDEVPDKGTEVDFTPRAGMGVTARLGDSNARVDIGLRWQHFSNGSFEGSDDNPSRDSAMVYAALVFPWGD